MLKKDEKEAKRGGEQAIPWLHDRRVDEVFEEGPPGAGHGHIPNGDGLFEHADQKGYITPIAIRTNNNLKWLSI